MKKVLYVATVLSHICQFHLPYLKMFQEKGYEVQVAAHDNLAEKNGLQLKYVDKHFEIPFQRSPFSRKNITSYKQLKKILDYEQYDLIVCNTPVGGMITRLAAKKARKNGTKVVYIAHGFHFYKGAPKKNWLLYYPIEKYLAKHCDTVVTIVNEDYVFADKKFKTNIVFPAGDDLSFWSVVSGIRCGRGGDHPYHASVPKGYSGGRCGYCDHRNGKRFFHPGFRYDHLLR